jgi:hypothetical protein
MIVFDLKCDSAGHVFEAWFSNSDAFADQQQQGLLSCPICGDRKIAKAATAVGVPKKGNATTAHHLATTTEPTHLEAKELLAAMAKTQAKLLEDSQWVGRKFDVQARAMDAGEIERSAIHGEVTATEAQALLEDGVAVMPLPFPVIPPEKRN